LPQPRTNMKPAPTILNTLRDSFRRLDLRGKLTVALLGGTLVLGVVVTLTAYVAARHQISAQSQMLLEARGKLERREIELTLSGMVDLAESIATNTVTANALADSRGREIYLTPLLRNQKLAVAGASLTVVDYRGRPVASSADPAPDYGRDGSFAAMMAAGKPQAGLLREPGKAMLQLALPIRYRLTEQTEGGVLLRIPLASLLGPSNAIDGHWLKDSAGQLAAGRIPEQEYFSVDVPLALPNSLAGVQLTLSVAHDRADAMRSVQILMGVFLLIGVFVVAAVVAFARAGARFITAPLGDIALAAEQIAASGRPVARLPERGKDEFGRIAVAFNTMVDRLAESYAELENRVAERTRDYEESRHEAEKASNLLREAVQSIALGFTIYDENDRLVLCNDAYLSFYETSRDLIVPGASFEEIVRRGAERGQYAEAIGRVDPWVATRVAQHQGANGEVIEQQLSDGRWLMIVEHRTPSGYIVGNRIDITELKAATEALRQRELYLRATLDNLPFFFWLKDADCRFLAVNKVFANACGRSGPADVVGLTDHDVWPPELAQRYRTDDFEVMASRREKSVEERVAGGSEDGWIETYKKPVIAPDGTILGTVGFARDISDRRRAEARAHEHAEQLNAIFELSPDGFVSFDGAHCVKYVSPAFCRLTGLEADACIGLDENVFARQLAALCTPEARFAGLAPLRRPRKTDRYTPGAAHDRRQTIEIAGPGRRVLEVGLRESRAETVSQILYLRDITHETEVDQIKSEFLSTAAHELRTPMASIYGFAELMLAQEFEPDEQREFLATIFRQSELMVSIINELLDLARIEARRGKDFNIQRIDLGELLREIVSGFKSPDGRPSPPPPTAQRPHWVRGDRKKLTQAIGNVLSNAYKYSPGGGSVSIEFPEAAEKVGIRIRDQGMGMTPEQLERVFERFYRADSSGKIPGTGLGMSIVKEIVELHGGHIELESKIGAGTTVTIWLQSQPAATAGVEPTDTVQNDIP
jgi:PAS domain S-box-containing protein